MGGGGGKDLDSSYPSLDLCIIKLSKRGLKPSHPLWQTKSSHGHPIKKAMSRIVHDYYLLVGTTGLIM